MTDSWARPSDDGARARRPSAQVEIELDGAGASAGPGGPGGPGGLGTDESSDSGEPNWRIVAGAASVAGVVIGLIAAGVIFWSGGDDEPSTTTVPVEELAAEITAPPTLPPVDTVPPTTIRGLEQLVPEPRLISVPTYPPPEPFETPWPDATVEFPTLERSLVADIVSDSALNDGPTESTIRWDAVNQRFELRFELPVGTSRTIFDVTTGDVYEAIDRPRSGVPLWTRTPGTRYFPPDVDPTEYFASIALGPVRADNVDQVMSTNAEAITYSVLEVPSRRTTYTMPEPALGPWGDPDGTGAGTFDVYADQDGQVVRTQGTIGFGGSPAVLIHTPRPFDVTIELPDEGDVANAVDGGESGVLPTGATAESLRPNYETVEPVPANSTGRYSIAAALDQLYGDPPAGASVDVLWADNAARFSAQRDDANDRRLMTQTIDSSPTMTVQVDDAASAATFLTDDIEGTWTRLTSTGQGGRKPPVDERLISGVLPRSSIEDAEVLAFYRYVVMRDGTIALEAHLRLEPGEVSLPSVVPMSLDPNEPVEVYLYVGAGVVHEIHVLSNQGEPHVLVQRFDLRADPDIALPAPTDVVDG